MFNREDSQRVKGVAILLLIFHHLFWDKNFILGTRMTLSEASIDALTVYGRAARICVWMFAFVSAFGLTKKYLKMRNNATRYYVNSWFSLMHRYWIFFFVGIAICGLWGRNPWNHYEHNIGKAVLDFFAWSDFFQTPRMSGAWWYMCFAQVVIMLIPFMVAISEKTGALSIPLTYFALHYFGPNEITSSAGGKYSSYFIILMLGVYCARTNCLDYLIKRNDSLLKDIMIVICMLAVAAGLLVVRHQFILLGSDPYKLGDTCITFSAFLLIIALTKGLHLPLIDKILQVIGKYSPGMFMVHSFMYTDLSAVTYWNRHPALIFLTVSLVSFVISFCVEWLIKLSGYSKAIKKFSTVFFRDHSAMR